MENLLVFIYKAKTRLALIKPLTIPRLELDANLLLTNLYTSVKEYLEFHIIKGVTFFTDALVVLGWLRTPTYRLKTDVANRVVKSLDLVNVDWGRHILTSDNPADSGSRGLLPSQLYNHTLWWCGPTWINLPSEEWPSSNKEGIIDDLQELKPAISSLISTNGTSEFLDSAVAVPDLIY